MKIESILNQFNELDTEARTSRESTHHDGAQWERRGSSFLSTPPPESAQSRTSSVRSDSRTRTPWDAGGYSLPRDSTSTPSSRSPFSAVSWGEQQESQRLQNASNHALRKVSMDASASYTLPVRRMASTPDVHQDAWTPKSHHSEGRPSQHIRRSSLWTDYNTSPASGSHRISDSRSSFSSCCSSTFSANHSRISSVSTINGSHAVGSGIADLEAKLERLPRLSAPLPPVITAPTGKPEIRLPHTANVVGPWSLGSPSDSILEARMARRKYSQLSGDQSYLKPKDHLLKPVDRIHKRTISAPNPAQGSTQPFTRTPTTLPPLTSRQFETVALPSPQINTVYERPSLEQYPWTHSEERSPAPSMTTKSPFDSQESGKISTDRSIHAMPHSNSNDRVIAACRRFRKVDVNTPLEGGDICMAVENCTTGSVPRKVISHLFGRNKVCTRRIPERVWVCMCRKHYQRIRYRTGADFSVTQIGMVYEQIVRMIFWSRGLENPNGTNQEGIAIRSWTFSIRRREVKRMADTNGRDLVPRWIMQSLGEGKTHDEILDVVERLHHEIQQGTLKDVPPVEFLPEVVDAFTNAPTQLQTQVSNGGEISFASHPGRSLNTGDVTESPASFVKEPSPLEPVQEEIYMSERNSEISTSSSTPPAAYDSSRSIYQPQSHIENVSNRRTSYAFGSRSPFADSGPGPDIDRRSSLAYHDSQNPVPPSISYHNINRQMQAPTTDHQGSFDSVPLLQTAHGGGYHHGLSEFVVTDRTLPNYTVVMPAMARESLAPYVSGHLTRSSRDNHELQASILDPQSTSSHINHHPFGSDPSQGQASAYPYRKPTERHCRTRMNSADISNYPKTPDERSYINVPYLQTHQPSWHPPATEWNAGIGRSTNQYQQHTLACVDEASLHHSHQYPKEETSEWSGVDRAAGNGISTVYPVVVCHPGHPNGSSSTYGFDVEHSRGNIKAYQHNWSTNESDNDRHGTRASESGRQERGQAP
ncbi:hypothetical protein FPOAC2_03126 [Fusarium poae]|uniref:Uncharacterized protein n=1 Tax=Fusarium poae TaxID=36050 RepID=A0A1B8B886_FUSPO|nr:hypothetical protein FPOAC1_003020 [Fusarium poae]KAG8677009.1 hypothetical protein FPOAC1_003020 [Fusarium poae]OBS28936.1 hypothetical protein FPOA_02871 [Fusarium poae]